MSEPYAQPCGPKFMFAGDDREWALHSFAGDGWWLMQRLHSGSWITVRRQSIDDVVCLLGRALHGGGLRIFLLRQQEHCLDMAKLDWEKLTASLARTREIYEDQPPGSSGFVLKQIAKLEARLQSGERTEQLANEITAMEP